MGLLRAVLDAWRAEVSKTGAPTLNMDEAFGLLGVPTGSDVSGAH